MFKIFMRIALGLTCAATGALAVYAIVSSKKRRKEKEKMEKVAKIVDEADKAVKEPNRAPRVKWNDEGHMLVIFQNKKTGERVEIDPLTDRDKFSKQFDKFMSDTDWEIVFD